MAVECLLHSCFAPHGGLTSRTCLDCRRMENRLADWCDGTGPARKGIPAILPPSQDNTVAKPDAAILGAYPWTRNT